ncbi:hypothetical protein BLOT_014815 [Blomia tropicalis]|nr:hypothetical protein BLOT_014815 [Blomia tropicalis]
MYDVAVSQGNFNLSSCFAVALMPTPTQCSNATSIGHRKEKQQKTKSINFTNWTSEERFASIGRRLYCQKV